MPTYNGARYLRESLASVAAQTDGGEIECLVIDDGSSDETTAILPAFARHLPLRWERAGQRRGWVANTNRMLARARGNYVTFLHQDDRWHPERLAVLRELCRRNRAEIIVHSARYIDAAGRGVGRLRAPLRPLPAVHRGASVLPRLLVQNFVALPAALVKRDALPVRPVLDTDRSYTADWDLWLSLAAAGRRFAYDPRPLVDYRIHATSQTTAITRDRERYRQELEAVYNKYVGRVDRPAAAAGRAALEINVLLAACRHGRARRTEVWRVLRAVAKLGPAGMRMLATNSRLGERSLARWRCLRTSAEEH